MITIGSTEKDALLYSLNNLKLLKNIKNIVGRIQDTQLYLPMYTPMDSDSEAYYSVLSNNNINMINSLLGEVFIDYRSDILISKHFQVNQSLSEIINDYLLVPININININMNPCVVNKIIKSIKDSIETWIISCFYSEHIFFSKEDIKSSNLCYLNNKTITFICDEDLYAVSYINIEEIINLIKEDI